MALIAILAISHMIRIMCLLQISIAINLAIAIAISWVIMHDMFMKKEVVHG